MPCSTHTVSHIININHQSGVCMCIYIYTYIYLNKYIYIYIYIYLTKDIPAHHNHPEFIVFLRAYSWSYTSNGLRQMYNGPYPSLWYHTVYFHCPIILCTLPIQLCLLTLWATTELSVVSIVLPFPECCRVGLIQSVDLSDCLFHLVYAFKIGIWLPYNVVLVSAIQWNESGIYIHISLTSWAGGLPTPTPQSHPSRSPQSTQLSSLHYTVCSD